MSNVVALRRSQNVDVQQQFVVSVQLAASSVRKLAQHTEEVFNQCIEAEARLCCAGPTPESLVLLDQVRDCQEKLFDAMLQMTRSTQNFAKVTTRILKP